jgi:hypothetical protein
MYCMIVLRVIICPVETGHTQKSVLVWMRCKKLDEWNRPHGACAHYKCPLAHTSYVWPLRGHRNQSNPTVERVVPSFVCWRSRDESWTRRLAVMNVKVHIYRSYCKQISSMFLKLLFFLSFVWEDLEICLKLISLQFLQENVGIVHGIFFFFSFWKQVSKFSLKFVFFSSSRKI